MQLAVLCKSRVAHERKSGGSLLVNRLQQRSLCGSRPVRFLAHSNIANSWFFSNILNCTKCITFYVNNETIRLYSTIPSLNEVNWLTQNWLIFFIVNSIQFYLSCITCTLFGERAVNLAKIRELLSTNEFKLITCIMLA